MNKDKITRQLVQIKELLKKGHKADAQRRLDSTIHNLTQSTKTTESLSNEEGDKDPAEQKKETLGQKVRKYI